VSQALLLLPLIAIAFFPSPQLHSHRLFFLCFQFLESNPSISFALSEEEESMMEAILIDCVQNSLRHFMHPNAIFICERLCAQFPSEVLSHCQN
jgi:hypothetical protein